jgi:hypothetical protein
MYMCVFVRECVCFETASCLKYISYAIACLQLKRSYCMNREVIKEGYAEM